MQLLAFLPVLLASSGLASPVCRNVNQPIYTLRLASPEPSLHNRPLTITNNSTLGVSASPEVKDEVHFYTVVNPTTGLAELHTSSPVNDATLTLIGSNGVLDFTPLKNPAAVTVPVGTTVDWTSFELDEGTPGEGTVKYVGKEGRWVMFPEGDEWELKWRSADAWTIETYIPVQVVYELVKEQN